MSDGSIQKPIPESGGSQTPSQKNAKNESTDSQHNNMTPPSGDESAKPKPFKIALIFAAFEAGGYIFSEIADGVGGYISVFIHWFSLCCAAAGFFAGWHEIVEGKKAFNIWILYGILCVFLFGIAYLVWRPMVESKHPHLTFLLQTEDAPDASLELTNDFLSSSANFDKIAPYLGFVLVPQKNEQSDFGLFLTVSNSSQVIADGVEVVASLSKMYSCSAGPGWMNGDSGDFSFGNGKTNAMQSWGFHLPFALRPGEAMQLSRLLISKPPLWDGGLFTIFARTVDSSPDAVTFHLSFVPPSKFVFRKPFVVLGTILTNSGNFNQAINLYIPPERLKQLQ